MKVLLDTNALLWAANGDLDKASVSLLDDEDNAIFYSTVSIWEIVIKKALERDDFQVDVVKLLDGLNRLGYRRLDIKEDHILAVSTLSKIHSDPFDRLLIAQAAYERMAVLSADKIFLKYGISVILVKTK